MNMNFVCHQAQKLTLHRITVKTTWGESNSQPLCYQLSALAIELNNSKASLGKESGVSVQMVYCIILLKFQLHNIIPTGDKVKTSPML